MGILDRPLFRRKLSKDELAMYGIQAFANGGIVSPYNMANGGPTDPSQLLPQTPPEEMYDSGFKSARETLVQAFMKKLNESGFMEELKKAQESGNKEMEATLVNMYKEMYQREVVDPVEAGSASGNQMGFNKGGDVKGFFSGSEVKKEEEEGDGFFSSFKRYEGNLDSTGKVKPKYPALEIQKNAIERQGEVGGSGGDTAIAETVIGSLEKNAEKKNIKRDENIKNRKKKSDIENLEETIKQQKELGIDTTENEKKLDDLKKGDVTVTETVTESKGDPNDPSTERENIRTLEEMVKERSDLYKSMLGDPKKQLAMQGYMQLAQFGLNLASAQGSNFAAKVANSAKDPLTAFAALGRQAQQDEDAITLAAIKSSEDERSQSLKPGGFAVLVNDLMNTDPKLGTEAAVAKAFEVYAAKSGDTEADIQREYFETLVKSYTDNDSMSTKDAITAAEAEVARKFGSKTGTGTDTPVIKIEDD